MGSCAYTKPKDSIHQKFKQDVSQNLLSCSTTSTSEHKIHQQSKHEVFCFFSFFLTQHPNLHPNPTRPTGKFYQKLKPDVPQNLLSNHAFQQIVKIPNGSTEWSPNGSKKWSRILVSSSLYTCPIAIVKAFQQIPNGSKRWSQRPVSGSLSDMHSIRLSHFFAVIALGAAEATAAQEAAQQGNRRPTSAPHFPCKSPRPPKLR